jgi:hypothetical protein
MQDTYYLTVTNTSENEVHRISSDAGGTRLGCIASHHDRPCAAVEIVRSAVRYAGKQHEARSDDHAQWARSHYSGLIRNVVSAPD